MQNNLIMHADNLCGLNHLSNSGLMGKIDLVYIDPPLPDVINKTMFGKLGRNEVFGNTKSLKIVCKNLLKPKIINNKNHTKSDTKCQHLYVQHKTNDV